MTVQNLIEKLKGIPADHLFDEVVVDFVNNGDEPIAPREFLVSEATDAYLSEEDGDAVLKVINY